MKKINVGQFLVLVQFVVSGALVLSARFTGESRPSLTAGGVGITLGVWSTAAIGAQRVPLTPDVKAHTQLLTAGPYRHVRHLMYTALLLFAGGFVFTPCQRWKICALFVLLFLPITKSRIEDAATDLSLHCIRGL